MNYSQQPSEYPGQSPEQRLQSARSWAERSDLPAPAVSATTTQMTERLQTVLDAAERAAEAIRQDAEEQARRHLAGAQQRADGLTAERVRLISQLTEDLIGHASVVRHHSEQMVGALDQAISAVTGRLDEARGVGALPVDGSPPAAVEAGLASGAGAGGTTFNQRPENAPASPPRNRPELGPGVSGGPPPAVALLRATQLAASGASRDSIAEAVRTEFGIDPAPVLTQVLD